MCVPLGITFGTQHILRIVCKVYVIYDHVYVFLWKQRTEAEQLDLNRSESWSAHLGHFASIRTNVGVSRRLLIDGGMHVLRI